MVKILEFRRVLFRSFSWEIDDMNEVMAAFRQNEDVEPHEAAEEWIKENQDKVDAWTEGIEPVEGESIELAYVNWDTELSSTNVVALVLKDLGYKVELTPLEDRKSTRLNSSHVAISYAVFCLKK